jgi:hypothetical protein
MPDTEPKADPTDTAAKLGARVAVAAFVLFSSLFVVSSTWQLTRAAVFQYDPVSSLREPPVDARSPCGADLRALTSAVERAISASRLAPDAETASIVYQAGLAPEWDRETAVRETCTPEPHGLEAFAAVSRLQRAGEAFARHRASDLARAHEDVAVALGSPSGR